MFFNKLLGGIAANYGYLLDEILGSNKELNIQPSKVTVNTKDSVFEFSRNNSSRTEKYMIVSAGEGLEQTKFSFSKRLGLLKLSDAQELSSSYGDIFQCRSNGWRAARKVIHNINIFPESEVASSEFSSVVQSHSLEMQKFDGMRVCIEMDSEAVTLERKQSHLAFTKSDSTKVVGIDYEIMSGVERIPCF